MGTLPTFLKDFLANRKFRVWVGSSLSSQESQLKGVPQGSVLSVILFAVDVNDTVRAVPKDVSCSLYVDGFALNCSGTSLLYKNVYRLR